MSPRNSSDNNSKAAKRSPYSCPSGSGLQLSADFYLTWGVLHLPAVIRTCHSLPAKGVPQRRMPLITYPKVAQGFSFIKPSSFMPWRDWYEYFVRLSAVSTSLLDLFVNKWVMDRNNINWITVRNSRHFKIIILFLLYFCNALTRR